jgi:hypothetical protein
MRMIMQVQFPIEPFNTAVRNGTAATKMKQILDSNRPEAAYFFEMNGKRGGILVVDLKDASEIPLFAEPWFLHFHAEINLRPAMTPEDLGRSNLDALGKKWA